MNYFLGISGGKLAADFEDTTNGGNHPVTATTTITTNVWHHAAVTYSTTTDSWSLYLDGVLDNTPANIGNFTPEFTSIQHAGIGTAINSTGAAAGFFAGVIDEARIWNVVRTAAEISANKNLELTSGTGLIGRWGLNEGTGLTAVNSVVGRPNGTLTNGPTSGFASGPNATGRAAERRRERRQRTRDVGVEREHRTGSGRLQRLQERVRHAAQRARRSRARSSPTARSPTA